MNDIFKELNESSADLFARLDEINKKIKSYEDVLRKSAILDGFKVEIAHDTYMIWMEGRILLAKPGFIRRLGECKQEMRLNLHVHLDKFVEEAAKSIKLRLEKLDKNT